MLKKAGSYILICLLVVLVLSGCGASKSSQSKAVAPEVRYNQAADTSGFKDGANSSGANVTGGKTAEAKTTEQAKAMGTSNSVAPPAVPNTQLVSNAILSQRKVIRNANLSVEVEDFDKAYGQIKSFITAFGYVQETNLKRDKYTVNGEMKYQTRGTIIVRVDKDRFDELLSSIKGIGTLLDESIKSDDVTDKFFDTESRLRVLTIEQDRLEEYLKSLRDPDVIFKTQSRLTQIRLEIENLTGTLRKWQGLVDLSTITINLSEKRGDQPGTSTGQSYIKRLFAGFVSSVKGVVEFCGDLVLILAQALPMLVLLGAAGFGVWKAYRRFSKRRFGRKPTQGYDNNNKNNQL